MAIFRFTASADTTITNAFKADLTLRGTGSNMGYADSVEIFSIAGQLSSSAAGASQELSRALIKFPITDISAARTAGTLPTSGNVSFFLRMYNAQTPWTLPQNFTLNILPVSRDWQEGTGLDMDNYNDLGEANWMSASTSAGWTSVGGDYNVATPGNMYTVTFPLGWEDIELDISGLVEQWIAGAGAGGIENYGVGVHLTSSQEAYFSGSGDADSGSLINNRTGSTQSYYTKKFFARSTEFFFKRPLIEARWDSTTKDERGQFYFSSSAAPAADNLNTIFLYNYVRGRLVNLPGIGTTGNAANLTCSFYSSSATGAPTGSAIRLPLGGGVTTALSTNATCSYVSTGIYSCSVSLTAGASPFLGINDVWRRSDDVEFFTGSLYPASMPGFGSAPTFNYNTNIRNLRKSYSIKETARFRTFVRSKYWNPTIYVKATANIPTEIINSASYSIYRVVDDMTVIAFGTGSDDKNCTDLSYDVSGNYFDLDISLLERGYMYGIKFAYYNDSIGSWMEQPETFKFRVEE